MSMKIGNRQFDCPIILAPMAGVTDRPFRQLCKKLGADLAGSEMVGAISLLRGCLKTKRRANHAGEVNPIWVQIVGADPEMLANAAIYNEQEGAEILDINMGCPAKKVCNMASGSALLRNENLVAKILEKVIKAVTIPVTLKIRTGWDKNSKNALQIAKIAENSGIQALTIHGRTRCCFFTGQAEYDTIAEVKASTKIPIIANGDINSPEKALHVLQSTKADGLMIGRKAQGRPWIFREIKHYLATRQFLPELTKKEIGDILLDHLQTLYDFYGEITGVLMARKHISWYSKGQVDSARFRNEFNKAENVNLQRQMVNDFFYS